MSLSVVQSDSNTSGTSASSSAVGQLVSTPTQSNLLLALISLGASATVTPPSGWTAIGTVVSNSQFYYKAAGASEPSSWTWSLSGAQGWVTLVTEITGATTGTAPQVGDTITGTTQSTATTPSITTTQAGDLILGYAVIGGTDSFTAPGSTTLDAQNDCNIFLGSNVSAAQIHDNSLQSSAGPTTQRAITLGTPSASTTYTVAVANSSVSLALSTAAGAFASTGLVTAGQILAPATSAGVFASTCGLTVPVMLSPTCTITGATTAFLATGLLPYWQYRFAQYKAGLAPLTIVAFGASLIEGYNVGSGLRTTDGFFIKAADDLLAFGVNPTVHPGVFYASTWVSPDILVTGSDPSGTDPWTRAGNIQPGGLDRGIADLYVYFVHASGASMSIGAPTWATHALIHYTDTGTGTPYGGAGGLGDVWTASSNGVTVLQHAMSGDLAERAILVPLQGSGNTFGLSYVTYSFGSGQPSFSGVTFQQRLNAPICDNVGSNAHNTFGGGAAVSLAGCTVGSLMLALANCDTDPPTLPSGWTQLDAQHVGANYYLLCYRVCQAGDTTATFTPSPASGGTDVALATFAGASIGQVTAVKSNATTASTITPNPLTIASPNSWSVLATGAAGGQAVTFPTGWLLRAGSNVSSTAAFGMNNGVPGGAPVTPGAIGFGSSPGNQVAWQIEITQTSTPVTENYLQIINQGHGGFRAYDFAFPVMGGSAMGHGSDVSFYWAQAVGYLNPALVIFLDLGYNDLVAGNTTTDFTNSLPIIQAEIDANCTYPPDYLCGMYTYLAENSAMPPYSETTWNSWRAVMASFAASLGVRGEYFNLENYQFAQPGPTQFTSLEPGYTNIAVHPTAYGDRLIGDIFAGVLTGSIEPLGTTSSAGAAATQMNLLYSVNETAGLLAGVAGTQTDQLNRTFITPNLGLTGIAAKNTGAPQSAGLSFVGSATRAIGDALTAGLGLSGATNNSTSRSFAAATLATTGVFVRGRNFDGGLPSSGYTVNATGAALGATLSPSGVTANATARGLSAGLPLTGTARLTLGRALSGGLSFTGASTRVIAQALAAVLSFTGSAVTALAYMLAATLGLSGQIVKLKQRFLTGTLNAAGSNANLTGIPLSGGLSSTGVVARGLGKLVAGVVSFTGSLSPGFFKVFTATLNLTGSIGETFILFIALFATLPSTGSLGRTPAKALTAALATSGTMARALTRNFVPLLHFTGSIIRGRFLAATIACTGATLLTLSRPLTATWNATGLVARSTVKSLAAILSFLGSRNYVVPLVATLAFVGTAAKDVLRSLGGGVSLSGARRANTGHTLLAVLNGSGAIVRHVTHALLATLPPVGAVARLLARTSTSTLTSSGTISNRSIVAVLLSTLAPIGTTARGFRQPLAAGLSTIGAMVRGRVFHATIAPASVPTPRIIGKALPSTLSFETPLQTLQRFAAILLQSLASFVAVVIVTSQVRVVAHDDVQLTALVDPFDTNITILGADPSKSTMAVTSDAFGASRSL